jgi:hypothetical protein
MTPVGATTDRRQLLLGPGATLNGIDYVEIASPDQTTLRVHFLNQVSIATSLGTSSSPPRADAVTITGGEVITSVAVLPVETADWSVDSEARPMLTVRVQAPGDFSTYRLRIDSTALDPFFDSAAFSFKANCPSDFDCRPAVTTCPPQEPTDVAIDYLAKDFRSFVNALSEFSAQRYPAWLERSEADLGMVVMEVLAAIADELSYYQDRIAGEALLSTATQPLSLLYLARLVDYEPRPATVATVLLQLDVSLATTVSGLHCQALGATGTPVDFEVGHGLADSTVYSVDPRWNRGPAGTPNLAPYLWDQSQRCLSKGSTRFDIAGWGHGLTAGQSLLIDTNGATSADPPVREIVVIGSVPEKVFDPVFDAELTRVTLQTATAYDHDLTRTLYAGNLVPATQGLSTTETFTIPADGTGDGSTPAAVLRIGPNWTPDDPSPDYRYSVSAGPLAWIADTAPDTDTPQSARPEIILIQDPNSITPQTWQWVRSLVLDAKAGNAVFTLTPEQYSSVLTATHRASGTGKIARTTWFDYDGGNGTTIRFGDGTFGSLPTPGMTFEVRYRVGGGSAGNVPADTVTLVPGGSAPVISCTNPFPASRGADAETPQQIRDRAPQAFQATPLRVVRPSDYVAAAQSLSWVQQAGTTFRWTGSWLTAITAADPAASEMPTLDEVERLTELLNRRRLAGYESYVLPPRYVSIDVQITLCAAPTYFAADVEAAVLSALRPGHLSGGKVGFFDHTRWRFGQPLESSALLVAVQACPGVSGVTRLFFRQRGVQAEWTALPDTVTVGADQILRVDDDPSRPEAGSLKVIVNGGKA